METTKNPELVCSYLRENGCWSQRSVKTLAAPWKTKRWTCKNARLVKTPCKPFDPAYDQTAIQEDRAGRGPETKWEMSG
jgi:hypothetical protein